MWQVLLSVESPPKPANTFFFFFGSLKYRSCRSLSPFYTSVQVLWTHVNCLGEDEESCLCLLITYILENRNPLLKSILSTHLYLKLFLSASSSLTNVTFARAPGGGYLERVTVCCLHSSPVTFDKLRHLAPFWERQWVLQWGSLQFPKGWRWGLGLVEL